MYMLSLHLLSAAHGAWQIHDGRLQVRTDVLDGFDEGGAHTALVSASRVWIDIGINLSPFSFWEEKRLRFALLGTTGMYLGFEGLVDKYAINVAKGAFDYVLEHGRSPPLGTLQLMGGPYKSKKPIKLNRSQALILPMAVSDHDNRLATFHVSNDDRCASLNQQTPSAQLSGTVASLASGCGTIRATRTVPTVTLEEVLSTWLRGRPVHWLKVDAQGSELSVLRSGRKHLRQVERFQLEIPSGLCTTLTLGAPSCEDIFAYAASMGYVAEALDSKALERAYAAHQAHHALTHTRNFTCAQVKQALSRGGTAAMNCEVDVLFVREDVTGSYRDVAPVP